ncbi:MAG: hypothetical protein HY785_09290 [Oscillatoriophycideae cyanobacterium NC_groundwater_1537_Pr4_S-0.65um_50_18]|nr:hypothetical protein [Oscillatoriophycideae cyanobacterium NC_groundwater_1537_Pr4_S-0.65um_50_18]
MKLFAAFVVIGSIAITAVLAPHAAAEVPKPAPSASPQEPSPPAGSSQLGTLTVPAQPSPSDRSQRLNQQAEAINESLPAAGQNRDLIQQVLGLPETVRVRPTRSGMGVTTQF